MDMDNTLKIIRFVRRVYWGDQDRVAHGVPPLGWSGACYIPF